MKKIERVLFVHNIYQQRSGEESVVAGDTAALRRNGVSVSQHFVSNDDLVSLSGLEKVRTALEAVWSPGARRDLTARIRSERPDVVYFHNTFPRISPGAYYACRNMGVPIVQTLQNYRLLCPNALFFRDGGPCEECIGKTPPWPGVVHGCYRDSRATTAVVAGMLTVHRALRTWQRMIDVYIAPTEFARSKFVKGGLPGDRIMVKANVPDRTPDVGRHEGGYALFVGRLSKEKGLGTLVRAWSRIGVDRPLKIVGSGPEYARSEGSSESVEWLGRQPPERVFSLMKEAAFLVMPSTFYETFGMTISEAYATGLPVVASRRGAMGEVVKDGRTGLHFVPGDPDDLAAKVEWAFAHPDAMAEMGRRARQEYERKYTPDKNYEAMMRIFRHATDRAPLGARSARSDSTRDSDQEVR